MTDSSPTIFKVLEIIETVGPTTSQNEIQFKEAMINKYKQALKKRKEQLKSKIQEKKEIEQFIQLLPSGITIDTLKNYFKN